MSTVAEDTVKVKAFIDKCVESLEKGNYAYVCDGYNGGNDGGQYDNTIQEYSGRIVAKLLSLGYIYTTNHGFGCKDWKFSKEISL
jgi:hypothetical protein